MKRKYKLLWGILFLTTITAAVKLASPHPEIDLRLNSWISYLILSLPVILLLIHSIIVLGIRRSFLIIGLASFIGWTMETIGLKNGTVFGGHYVYNNSIVNIGLVPLSVTAYWAFFIYTGYSIVNSFIAWSGKKKPDYKNQKIPLLLILILFDGLIVTAIDLFMDPLMVKEGAWTWLDGGPYFGVPVGNFIGWFVVTVAATGIFRGFEYFFPENSNNYDKNIMIIPVIGYGALSLSLAFSSFRSDLPILTLTGLLLMLPTVIVNIFFFYKWRKKSAINVNHDFSI